MPLILRRIAVITLLLPVGAGLAQNDKKFSTKAQARIVKEVRHQILMLPDFGTFDNLAFKLNGYERHAVWAGYASITQKRRRARGKKD